MLDNIPIKLRQLNQWVVADMSLNNKGEPKKIPLNPRTFAHASVDDPTTWGSFAEAIASGKPVGFVLSKDDPYCIIDLDDKLSNPASDAEKERFSEIIKAFDTYTELSTSGRGAHLILEGKIPKGVKRSHVEIYSDGRYMICTGNVVKNYPIAERQSMLDIMYGEMQVNEVPENLLQIDSIYNDAEILARAALASNNEKYNKLWAGTWQGDYPSQSEADFALASMFCFYTKDNNQVMRLFRKSSLGQRDKANRDDYFIGKYGIINKIRANELPALNFTELQEAAELAVKKIATARKAREAQIEKNKASKQTELQIPHGLVGELTEYFLATANRPVKEIALAAALTLLAGVAGRAFNVSSTGLNLYIILLAKTGSGKEAAQDGIERLIRAVRTAGIPSVEDFVGPAAFSSGQALIKVLSTKPCFFSVLGEFGLTLQDISDPRATSSTRMLKKVLLDLYTKSGSSSVLRSSVYSDVEKNTAIVQSPSITILGETTPETFFDALSETQIAEGLIPRFSIIQYIGERTARNENSGCPPSEQLVAKFSTLVAAALTSANSNLTTPVQIAPDAQALLNSFDVEADNLVNSHSENSPELHLWNRAHLKALKTSAVIAVGVNPINPVIDVLCATWAINFVRNDIALITKQFEDGEVGKGDHKQVSDLRQVILSYFNMDEKKLYKWGETVAILRRSNLIPYSYLSKQCKHASFRNDKKGQTVALKTTLQLMVETGMLKIVPNEYFIKLVKYEGICYSVTDNF